LGFGRPETRAASFGKFCKTFEKGVITMSETPKSESNEDFYPWGRCPYCRKTDGYINIGRSHWFYCKEHRVKWWVGSNLFGCWFEQTLDEQERIYNALNFGDFKHLTGREPYFGYPQQAITEVI
jgi:hypothetical protein